MATALVISHRMYRIDKQIIYTFFFIGINYMLVKNNELMTAKCVFALKYKGRKSEIRNE